MDGRLARGATARAPLAVAVTAVVGVGRLPHSIAGDVEVVAGLLASPSSTVAEYARFPAVATVGTVLGGTVFVSPLNYSYVAGGADG